MHEWLYVCHSATFFTPRMLHTASLTELVDRYGGGDGRHEVLNKRTAELSYKCCQTNLSRVTCTDQVPSIMYIYDVDSRDPRCELRERKYDQ